MDWKTFSAAFVAILLAELGDKTQLAAISFSAKSGKPVSVFLAAMLALGVVTLTGVLAGEALARVAPIDYVKKGAAALFVVIGVLMWFKVL